MKRLNLYFILIIWFSIQSGSHAQQITDNNNQWNIAIYGFTPNISSYSLRIGSDTLIGNTVYKKVQSKNDTTSNNWTTVNYIREDSLKRVYLGTGANEKLHYDFNLMVGDTFHIESQCRLIVSEIDSVEINSGEKRKRIRLAPIDDAFEFSFWIEGIGSPLGLMVDHSWAHCATDYGHNLTCFLNDGEVLYPPTSGDCWITSINELENIFEIKVFPNPFKEKLIISQLAKTDLKSISIFSSLGSKIKEIDVSKEIIEIDTSTFENGLYFLCFISKKGKIYSKKIIK